MGRTELLAITSLCRLTPGREFGLSGTELYSGSSDSADQPPSMAPIPRSFNADKETIKGDQPQKYGKQEPVRIPDVASETTLLALRPGVALGAKPSTGVLSFRQLLKVGDDVRAVLGFG